MCSSTQISFTWEERLSYPCGAPETMEIGQTALSDRERARHIPVAASFTKPWFREKRYWVKEQRGEYTSAHDTG